MELEFEVPTDDSLRTEEMAVLTEWCVWFQGADLTEYTLRLVGSDLENNIRKLLLAGELKYNLDCRVLNFSMGKPRMDPAELDDVEVEEL